MFKSPYVPNPAHCDSLWGSPGVNPVTGRKFRARSPARARMIRQDQCIGRWASHEPCSIFKNFDEQFSPVSGRMLQADVRGKWHRKCSPLKRGRKPAAKKSKSRSPSPKKRVARRKSPKRAASPRRSSVSRKICESKGQGYRAAHCVSPRRNKAYGSPLF